ncbi:hypothetical protein C9374_013592 [Naegleria lovaniensis]|uniref:BTB domain-containing protein n=1 Tax=Naegleria lovaniensis TaxID=51637 RepID=A0AA88KQA2_NAELO|nr:uncharacterized protein C9374_013592 [Naegleria lovaniensis]KAG2392107.1 hypothetical protein C9374_013592 [Naegleria lovaniensis]
MFIFGGRNQKNDFLNDLYMYDTTSKIWTEIVCDSMLPPQLFKHQTFAVNNQSFYVYGGELKDDSERSDALYRFDIGDKKWNLIEIISEQALDEESNKALPCAGHSCFVIQGKLLRIGGIAKKGDSCVRILNMADPGRPIPLCSYLENKRDEGFLCDVVFRLRDHEQNAQHEQGIDTLSYVLAHKAIIKARCSSLHAKILQSTETMSTHRLSGTFHENCEEITLVDITDCTTHIFEQYLNFLYTGSIHLNNLDDVKAFMAYVKQTSETHHYPFVSRICSLDERKDLGMTKQILAQLHQDFSSLINDHTYSDLVVVLDGDQGGSTVSQQAHNPPGEEIFEEEPFEIPETSFDIAPTMENGNNHDENDTAAVEIMSPLPKASSSSSNTTTNGIAVHRLIMARSPFFSRMFVTSGMLEAKEKVVHLSDYSTEVMLQVLNYLYTDTIVLTPRNCLGILVYCIMLDLVDMASCCRRMVVSLLDNSIVWSVFEIATLYNDKSLESECERYVLARYEDLCNSIGFLQLPEMTRIKIKQAFEKRKKHK